MLNENYVVPSFDGSEAFLLGIIDFLSTYEVKKKSAHFFKSFLWEGETLSTVPSSYYAERLNFFLMHVILPRNDPQNEGEDNKKETDEKKQQE